MSDAALKAMIRYQAAKGEVDELAHRFSNEERGEMGSWMILAAGLALAAATAVGLLATWFGQKTTAITSK